MNNLEITDTQLKLIAKREDMYKELGKEIYKYHQEGFWDNNNVYVDNLIKDYYKKIKEIEVNLQEVRGDAEKRRSDKSIRESPD